MTDALLLDRTTMLRRPPAGSPASRPTGEGVDRRVRRRRPFRKAAVVLGALGGIALAVWGLRQAGSPPPMRVEADHIRTATVERVPFQEYVSVSAVAEPLRTVLLDAVVGGQVVRRLVEEGDTVAAGQPLFVLKNDDLALDVLGSEAQLEEQAATLRQSRLALDRNSLDLQQQLAELDFKIESLAREEGRLRQLAAAGAGTGRDLDAVTGELAYARRRRDLTLRAHDHDQTQRAAQLADIERALGRHRANLRLLREARNDLVVRAPVAGQFSALEAERGELKTRGMRLGQIDVLDEVKLRATLSEHYLARVVPGQAATALIGGETYALRVRAVSPDVEGGRFDVELVFADAAPADLRRGQSLPSRIELGTPASAAVLPRAPFYEDTAGQWVYVVADDGAEAVRRSVEVGRANPSHVEILGGLAPGDRVIVSSYAPFGEADVLRLH